MQTSNKYSIIKTGLLLASLPLVVFAVKKVIDLRKSAAGIPANILVDVNNSVGPVPSSLWRNLAQGGEENTDMIAPVISQVKALSPQLIRLDHLIDFYGVYNGPGNYNFSRLDSAVKSVLTTGAKPLLSISYTPASMAKNGQVAGEPQNWDDWTNLVSALARRYSLELNISGIYYEVWNEPDLFGGWHYAKSPSYTTLYIKTVQAVRLGAGGASYKVGGPATTGFYSAWIRSLFKTCQDYSLPLDFISYHRYSKNMADFNKDFQELTNVLTDYPRYFGIERLITEIGPNPEPDPWYDNYLSGVHLLSLSTHLAGKIHRIFPFEIIDGPTSRGNSTGWGLITHSTQGLKTKPRYAAIQFLNRLSGNRLSLSNDGTWVTALATKNGSTLQTLVVNYDSSLAHRETPPLTFKGITPGKYRLIISYYPAKTKVDRTVQVTVPSYSIDPILMDMSPNTAMLIELIAQ